MVKCSQTDCTEILNYLPFKCRYCGRTFCKKHRLPENHECTFSIGANSQAETHPPSVDKSFAKEMPYSTTNEVPYNSTEDYDKKLEKEMRDYIKAQERQAMPPPPTRSSRAYRENYSPFITRSNKRTVTYTLMGVTLLFYIGSEFLPGLFFLNANLLISDSYYLYFQTIITSLLTPRYGDTFLRIFSLLITEFMLYSIGKSIEAQFGPKFFLTLYGVAGLSGVIVVLIVQWVGPFISIFPGLNVAFLTSTQWCAILGMMSFLIHLMGLDREIRMYLYFIPIRLKGKYILYGLLGYASIIAIVGLFSPLYSTAEPLGQIAAIFAGKLMFHKFGRRMNTSFY
jgi:uncharacterized protein